MIAKATDPVTGQIDLKKVTGDTNNQPITGHSELGDYLRYEMGPVSSFLGWALGGAADIGTGVVNIFGGNMSDGYSKIIGGAGSYVQIIGTDTYAAIQGGIGKAYVLISRDIPNVLTGGQLTFTGDMDRSGVTLPGRPADGSTGFLGGLTDFGKDLIIPNYGFMLGSNWGTSQSGPEGPYLNQGDYASLIHDNNLQNRVWDKNQWTPGGWGDYHREGVLPNGPVGEGIKIIGTPVFWFTPDPKINN